MDVHLHSPYTPFWNGCAQMSYCVWSCLNNIGVWEGWSFQNTTILWVVSEAKAVKHATCCIWGGFRIQDRENYVYMGASTVTGSCGHDLRNQASVLVECSEFLCFIMQTVGSACWHVSALLWTCLSALCFVLLRGKWSVMQKPAFSIENDKMEVTVLLYFTDCLHSASCL